MNGGQGERRVVIALTGAEGVDRIARLLALARGLARRVEVAWIEDPRLLHAAALPFTRMVTRFGRMERLELEEVRHGLRLFAARLEHTVRELAAGDGVTCRFVDYRRETSVRFATPEDVLVLAPADLHALVEGFGIEPLTRDGPVLVPLAGEGPAVVASGGDPRTLELARRLAAAGVPLHLLHRAGTVAAKALPAGAVVVREAVPSSDPLNPRLRDLIQRGARLVVVDPALVPELVAALGVREGGALAGDDSDPRRESDDRESPP